MVLFDASLQVIGPLSSSVVGEIVIVDRLFLLLLTIYLVMLSQSELHPLLMHHSMSGLGTPATSQNTVALLSSTTTTGLAGLIFNILGASVIGTQKYQQIIGHA